MDSPGANQRMVKSVMLWVTCKSRGRTAHSRTFAVGSTQRWRRVIGVFVNWAAPRIHKEVDDGRHFQTQLFGNRRLDLFAWTLDLAEDGHQGAPLDLREHHPGLLGRHSRPRISARRCSTRHIVTSLSTCTDIHQQIICTALHSMFIFIWNTFWANIHSCLLTQQTSNALQSNRLFRLVYWCFHSNFKRHECYFCCRSFQAKCASLKTSRSKRSSLIYSKIMSHITNQWQFINYGPNIVLCGIKP